MLASEVASGHSYLLSVAPLPAQPKCFRAPFEEITTVSLERLVCSPPTKTNRVQYPAGSLPDFRMWESRRTMPPVRGFSRGSHVSPALSYRRRSTLTSNTLIGLDDLAVKSRSNLFTHSAKAKIIAACDATPLSLHLPVSPEGAPDLERAAPQFPLYRRTRPSPADKGERDPASSLQASVSNSSTGAILHTSLAYSANSIRTRQQDGGTGQQYGVTGQQDVGAPFVNSRLVTCLLARLAVQPILPPVINETNVQNRTASHKFYYGLWEALDSNPGQGTGRQRRLDEERKRINTECLACVPEHDSLRLCESDPSRLSIPLRQTRSQPRRSPLGRGVWEGRIIGSGDLRRVEDRRRWEIARRQRPRDLWREWTKGCDAWRVKATVNEGARITLQHRGLVGPGGKRDWGRNGMESATGLVRDPSQHSPRRWLGGGGVAWGAGNGTPECIAPLARNPRGHGNTTRASPPGSREPSEPTANHDDLGPRVHGARTVRIPAAHGFSTDVNLKPHHNVTVYFDGDNEWQASSRVGAAVAERLARSPPNKANRVRSPAGSLTDFRMWGSCRTMPLAGGFSRDLLLPPTLPFWRCSILT
ncbi:hypothetical protein PR048_006632 [Dryococelus australis]|uniref:Uncharacterized protein n=1 Tax=Dryococelus australis TaxID=614101 RepID=A0ABQ9IC52_9NEOP|nr:hypothetical protein PR048_006632 [Dryococelus australis]